VYCPIRAVDPVTGDDVDLSSATLKMALMPRNDRPDAADWVAATNAGVGLVANLGYTFARVLVGTGGTIVPKPGDYDAWVQVGLGSEIVEENSGRIRVL
jgi:hypothetical protein